MIDDCGAPEDTAPAGRGEGESDSAVQAETFAQLSTACSEYLDSYLVLAQLHGQRLLLSLFKMFFLAISTLILLLATWGCVLFALFSVAVQIGLPPAIATLLVGLGNLGLAWWCWGCLCRRLQNLIPSPSNKGQNEVLSGGLGSGI